MGIIISDEYSYLDIGLQLSQHFGWAKANDFNGINQYYQSYVLGYPFIIALVSLLGVKASYVGNFILLLVAVYFQRKICKKVGVHPNWAYGLTFFMPVVFSSRLLMSEMSAMVTVTIFLYAFYDSKKVASLFIMGIFCTLSYWFREGTIVLLAPLLAYRLYHDYKGIIYALIGLVLGATPMLLQQSFYGAISIRNTGVSFGPDLIWQNLGLVIYIFSLVFPLGIWVIYRSRIKHKKPLMAAMCLYVAMQVLYQYNGWELTGAKSLVSYPRFFVAVAPIMILLYGSALKNISHKFIYFGSILTFLVFSCTIYFVDNEYEKVRDLVYDNVADSILHSNGSINEISKIVFPDRGELSLGMFEYINKDKLHNQDFVLDVSRNDSAIWKGNILPYSGGTVVDSISILGFLNYKLFRIE